MTSTAPATAPVMAGLTDQTVYVGIDPSLVATGVCILDPGAGGVHLRTIATSPRSHGNRFLRLDHIVRQIVDIIGSLAIVDIGGSPAAGICVESPFVNPRMVSDATNDLIALGHLIRRALFYGGVEWTDVAPSTLKKFVCGQGHAQKGQMMLRVYKNWGISPGNDNEADAAGLAKLAQAIGERESPGTVFTWTAAQLEVAGKLRRKRREEGAGRKEWAYDGRRSP